MDVIAAMIYAGGAGAVYDVLRAAGRARWYAVAEAAFWPIGLGQAIARRVLAEQIGGKETKP